jgi:hypothetical protein
MSDTTVQSKFYFNMGLLMLALVVAGFASAAVVRGSSPLELPTLFHVHGLVFIAWFLFFINQARLIGNHSYAQHKKLGLFSLVIVAAMLVTGTMMAGVSFQRGISPVPDTTIQQFMALPLADLFGLLLFYTLGVLNRGNGLFHKHCMLMAGISIMDPGIARIAIVIGFMPIAMLLHLGLVGIVMVHDRRTNGAIHVITWAGLAFVILRLVFIFTVGASSQWASLMDGIFG